MFKRLALICLSLLLFCGFLLAKEECPFLGLVTNDNINVRAGANINFEVLCKLTANEKVVVVGKNYNWYKIILPKDAACYVNEKYVLIEESQGLITGNRINIRAKPNENSSILGQVNKGGKIKILKKVGEWYSIEPLENCFGWVHEKFLRYYSEFKKGPAVSAETGKETPSSEVKVAQIAANKTELSQKEPAVDNIVSAVGIVEPMGRVFNRAGTHKLISDGKIAYILSGDRNKLDNFINYRVKVIGDKSNPASSKFPLIVVKQISACE